MKCRRPNTSSGGYEILKYSATGPNAIRTRFLNFPFKLAATNEHLTLHSGLGYQELSDFRGRIQILFK